MRSPRSLAALLFGLLAACGGPAPSDPIGGGGAGGASTGTELTCDANALDFGTVVVGEQATRTLTCTLVGDEPLSLARAVLSGEDASSFRVDLAIGGPALRPGESLAIPVVLAATRPAGPRAATLRLVDAQGHGRGTIALRASLIPAALELSHATGCDPALDFGAVPPGERAERTLELRNVSAAPRLLQRLTVEAGAAAGFTVGGGLPYVLQPGERFFARVGFAPTAPGRVSGSLRLGTDDPAATVRELCVSGFGGGPRLRCEPDRLDFGPQIVGHPAPRRVSCTNEGTADPVGGSPLVIEALEFDAPGFAAAPMTGALPMTLVPGERVELEVVWTPEGAGPVAALLTIASNDPARPRFELALQGEAEAFDPCSFALRSTSLEFGSVGVSEEVTLDVALRNEGATECLVTGLRIEGDGAMAFTVPEGGAPLRLLPFAQVLLPVRFAPPLWQARWEARVAMTIFGPVEPVTTIALSGASPASCLFAEPLTLDFGDVQQSCTSLDRTIELVNRCELPQTVTAIAPTAGSSAAFALARGIEPPLTIAPGARTSIAATFTPPGVGRERGALLLESEGGTAGRTVGLVGTGRTNSQRTDRFVVPPNDAVDVLFVIDVGDGLVEEQLAFDAHAGAFVDELLARGIDARIGVISTGTGGCGGALTSGKLLPVDGSRPRILTSRTPGLAVALAQNFRVAGCPEHAMGLQTATVALSRSAVELAADGEALLRRDAHLAVIFVSPREDESPETPSAYGITLRAAKSGWYGVSAHALAGCAGTETGARYRAVAETLGGSVHPFCADASEWGAMLEALAAGVTRRPSRMVLGGEPDDMDRNGVIDVPAELSLRMDGRPVAEWNPAGERVWTYSGAGAIDFSPSRAPEAGTTLEAMYNAVCR